MLFKDILLYIRLWINLSHKTSRKLDIIDLFFILIAVFSSVIILTMFHQLSLSEKELNNLFYNNHFFFEFLRTLIKFFGTNDFVLKLPLLILHILNLMLLYGICRHTLKNKSHSLICIMIYILLPGVNLSAILLIECSWIIFLTFFVGYIYTRYQKIPIILLAILSIATSGATILLIAIAIFSLKNKQNKIFIFCIACLAINWYLYDFNIGGKPQAYFLETLAQIAILYSPLLFIYYAYSIYWSLRHQNTILPYIAATSIVFCIILSLRQNINFYILIPQSLVALPIMIQCFMNDLKVRLPQFRKNHYVFASLILLFLVLQTSVIFGNKITYLFSNKPNFASNYYFAKEIAMELKKLNINAIHTTSPSLRKQLAFYGIKDNKNLILLPSKSLKKSDIIISYNNTPIYLFQIYKK